MVHRFIDLSVNIVNVQMLFVYQFLGVNEGGWSSKVDQAEEVKAGKHFSVDKSLNKKVALW